MKKIQCSIDNYINGNNSICREERQYALYLSNVLRKYNTLLKRAGKKDVIQIFKVCGIPEAASVQYVFYEAAFMRDFFQRNRRLQFYYARVGGKDISNEDDFWNKSEYSRSSPICEKMDKEKSFNRQLFKYCYKKLQIKENLHPLLKDEDLDSLLKDVDIEEVHYGVNRKDSPEMTEKIPEIEKLKDDPRILLPETVADKLRSNLREMMNSKPDIAVIYEDRGKRYLLFLECKFESGESTSRSGSSQTLIQWKIAHFLCEHHFFGEDKIYVSEIMDEDKKSKKVVFTRKDDSSKIRIGSLIELERGIFE